MWSLSPDLTGSSPKYSLVKDMLTVSRGKHAVGGDLVDTLPLVEPTEPNEWVSLIQCCYRLLIQQNPHLESQK